MSVQLSRHHATSVAYVGLFAALMAVLGLVPKVDLPFGVPITLQSLGVMLAGCLLGSALVAGPTGLEDLARIAQKGLVGDYYVLLELRGDPGARLAPGADIPAVATLDVQELAAKAGDLLDNISPKINGIADNIAKLFTEENTESLKRALEGTPALVADLRRAANDFRKNWDALSTKGGKAAESLDATLQRTEKAVTVIEGELTKTLRDFRKQADGVGGLVGDVRQGFNYDQEQLEDILKNLNRTSREIRELAGRLRERPWELLRPPSGK